MEEMNGDLQAKIKEAGILVVDDNATNVLLLTNILKQEGYQNISSTTDSREACPIYEKGGIDIILLDINMPHMDGFDVMRALADLVKKETFDYIPVLVLTAQTDKETRLRALEYGAKDFITKPFERVEVLHRIQNMLEVRILHRMQQQQNIILEEKVQERTQELHESRLDIIRRLGQAAEFKDNETGMHVVRMSKACELLARSAGLEESMCRMILHASPMHDIGKIGIPDRILLKPDKLDAEEWDIMKKHAEIGADILSEHPSEIITMARTIALTHHEKWDGSGYPKGLKGEEIPIEGRITAVCDVFDALTSERPYKKAWSTEDSVNFIKENSGLHFDPNLVEHFLKILPEVLAIRDEFSDTQTEQERLKALHS